MLFCAPHKSAVITTYYTGRLHGDKRENRIPNANENHM